MEWYVGYLIMYLVKPMLICHLRGSYNTLWCCSIISNIERVFHSRDKISYI